ncbi:hypothetical protein OH492_01710 [Vibrio chagasii]|nr:hypothetical protein [Vibrio chagasii]
MLTMSRTSKRALRIREKQWRRCYLLVGSQTEEQPYPHPPWAQDVAVMVNSLLPIGLETTRPYSIP